MQSWQIKALELEVSALTHLDGFIRDHALWFFIGVIYLLLALLAWVLSGALRRKGGNPTFYVRPTIVIQQMQSPPPSEPVFDPFPPLRDPPEYDHDEDWD
jgi:hypothetical protein